MKRILLMRTLVLTAMAVVRYAPLLMLRYQSEARRSDFSEFSNMFLFSAATRLKAQKPMPEPRKAISRTSASTVARRRPIDFPPNKSFNIDSPEFRDQPERRTRSQGGAATQPYRRIGRVL